MFKIGPHLPRKKPESWYKDYAIPNSVEVFLPKDDNRACNPPIGCVAFNPSILNIGLGLSFCTIRGFLSTQGIAPNQFYPNKCRSLLATYFFGTDKYFFVFLTYLYASSIFFMSSKRMGRSIGGIILV